MKKIIINQDEWQTRVAILQDDVLENVYFSSESREILERVYFKGVVTKVLPGIQTAFVNIGQKKAGFLHISEVDHESALESLKKNVSLEDEDEEDVKTKRQKSYERLSRAKEISNIFKEGDHILVQVNKEPIYEKGPKLTTCFTLPGRFLVLMPNIPRIGVSKKIADRTERIRLKDVIKDLVPEGMGVIIRTTAQGATDYELEKDLSYLVKEWRSIEYNFTKAAPEEKLHADLPLPLHMIRDYLDNTVSEVIIDNAELHKKIVTFVKSIASEHLHKILLFSKQTPIFTFYDIEKKIEKALEKKVHLESGGSLIVENTEAMTVIDVNTGRFIGKSNLEETILKINLEAAEEIVHQLKLRNIGGLIVIDFIDMKLPGNKQKLFVHFEQYLKKYDRSQSVVLHVSDFGLVQMTRKRTGKALWQELCTTCQTCLGLGFVKSIQTESYTFFRALKQTLLEHTGEQQATIEISPELFQYVTSKEFNAILALEKTCKKQIVLICNKTLESSLFKIKLS
jgi:ribonuclease G